MLYGVHLADGCCVVALPTGADGTKVLVGRVAASLTNTNCIESMISIAARHDQERVAVARRQDDQMLMCRQDAQRGTQLPPARGLPADAGVRRCARPSPRSCSTGMGCCTSRMSGPTDAHRPVVATL
jgi:hypothetical protein